MNHKPSTHFLYLCHHFISLLQQYLFSPRKLASDTFILHCIDTAHDTKKSVQMWGNIWTLFFVLDDAFCKNRHNSYQKNNIITPKTWSKSWQTRLPPQTIIIENPYFAFFWLETSLAGVFLLDANWIRFGTCDSPPISCCFYTDQQHGEGPAVRVPGGLAATPPRRLPAIHNSSKSFAMRSMNL